MIALALIACADTATWSGDTGVSVRDEPLLGDPCPLEGGWSVLGGYCGAFVSLDVEGWVARGAGLELGGCALELDTPTCTETLSLNDRIDGTPTWATVTTDGGCNDGFRELPAVTVVPESDSGAVRVDADGLGWFDIEDDCPAYHAYFVLVPW